MKCAVYRFFNKDGQLLYVGMSVHPFDRFEGHLRRLAIFEVALMTISWFDDKEHACDAELLAIKMENPLWNISNWRGSPNAGRPRVEDRAATVEAQAPWVALGMSRRTWYRRRKRSAVDFSAFSRQVITFKA